MLGKTKAEPVKSLDQLLATIDPVLIEGEFVFCTFPAQSYGSHADLGPVCAFLEPEGLTLVIPKGRADRSGIEYESTFAMITLRVDSSLDAVGFTAAISARLASKGISVNVVSAFHHDHLFVPSDRGEEAIVALMHPSSTGSVESTNLLRRLHLWFGFAVLAVFLGTGFYMRMGLGGLKEMDLATRVLYRSRHIYILCSSLVHIAMGSYLFASKSRAGRFLQRVGSALLFLASPLLVVAFFREPPTGIASTPFSRYGLFTLLAGTLCHALGPKRGQEPFSRQNGA